MAGMAGMSHACWACLWKALWTPLGSTPMVVLAAYVLPTASAHVKFTALNVLVLTLSECHVEKPLCRILSASAAWDLLDGFHVGLRFAVSVYVAVVSPAFPLDSGTPLRNERVADAAPADEHMNASTSTGFEVARSLLPELGGLSTDLDSQSADQQSGLTQQVQDMSLEDASCPVCLDPFEGRSYFAWPNCGSVTHQLHVACAAALTPMQRGLAHLLNTNDATRVCEVPCVICRTPWGDNAVGNAAVQRFCNSLEAEGIPLPARGCECGACRNAAVSQNGQFEVSYGNARAVDIRRFCERIALQARQAQDVSSFLQTQRWSDVLVPFIWMAASEVADDSTQWPQSLEQCCSQVQERHESGLRLGPASIREARLRLRNSFRASGINSMEDLRIAIRNSKDQIAAWARADSRFSALSPVDDHFNVGRGAYLQDYIQEWILIQSERAVPGSRLAIVLSANFQEAVRLAAQRPAESSPEPGSTSLPGRVFGGLLIPSMPGVLAPSSGATSGAAPSTQENAPAAQSADAEGAARDSQPSRRRRLNSGAGQGCSRVFCPVPGCPDGDPNRAEGWSCHQHMRDHLDEHCAGIYAGAVPQAYLTEHRLGHCHVCSRLLATRFGNAHPRCRPRLSTGGRGSRNGPQQRADSANLINLEDIFTKRVSTKAGVPKEARRMWSQCLAHALSEVVRYNDARAWSQLLMLAKCVLRTAARGRRGAFQNSASETRNLCRRWLDGQRLVLWNQGREIRARRGARAQPSREEIQTRIAELVSQEQFHKACGVLVNEPPVEVTRRVIASMEAKHPAERAPLDWSQLRTVHSSASPQFDVDLVKKVLRSFPKGSAGGLVGLKPQHLKDAMTPGSDDEVGRLLAIVLSMLARGDIPAEVRPLICGASLVALPKRDGGLRPIAVGDTLRRLVGKCLAHSVKEQAQARLEPTQVGVGTPGGAEAVIHVVRDWFRRHSTDPTRVALKIDMENAFNSIDRQAILEAVRAFSPTLVPWADFTYGGDSSLLLGEHKVASKRGVQQGDPLGPLLFSLALQRAIEEAKRRAASEVDGSIDFQVFYLDDGFIAGTAPAVSGYADILCQELARIGLTVNAGKCEAIPAAGESSAVQASSFHPCKWVAAGEFELLGAPIGGQTYSTEYTSGRIDKGKRLLAKLAELEDPQVAYLLARHCASFCRLTYSTRVTPRSLHSSALKTYDDAVREGFSGAAGLLLPDDSWSRAQLSARHGGIGFRSSAQHADAAFVSSIASASALGARIDPGFDVSCHAFQAVLDPSLQSLRSKLPPSFRLESWLDEGRSQRELSSAIDSASVESLLLEEELPVASQAHLLLMLQEGSGSWLHATPSRENDTIMPGELFRIALKRRLRLPLLEEPGVCPCCGQGMDIYMDHALVCPCKGDRTLRHNALRNLVCVVAELAGLRPEKEKSGLLPKRPQDEEIRGERLHNGRRPADIWVPQWQTGRPAAWDFAVTSGLQQGMLFTTVEEPSAALTNYERYKREFQDTTRQCDRQGLDFLPLVAEAHSGAWGPTARAVWHFLAKTWAASTGTDMSVISAFLAQRTSVTLHRENARAILRRMTDICPDETTACPEAWLDNDGDEDEDAYSVASGD